VDCNKNGETVPQCLFISRASNLSEDLEDEEFFYDEGIVDLKTGNLKGGRTHKKKSKSYDKTKVRRSSRIRFIKSKS
jgi:hypothetical protein